MSDIDILQIHQTILYNFKKQEEKLFDYKRQLIVIEESLQFDNLLHRTIKTLGENKEDLCKKIKDIVEKEFI